ncbi:hypothetical protein [Streptomyces sp. NPDC056632]|uniref:hypothetical protein n=1 Tax=Streptomyces sp. NPDC056632 TaxID=3345884 RepID=UPI00369836DE
MAVTPKGPTPKGPTPSGVDVKGNFNPTPVPTKIPTGGPQSPDINPEVDDPDFGKPKPASSGPNAPRNPNEPVEYGNSDGPIVVIPSELKPHTEKMGGLGPEGYQRLLDLETRTGGSLGDGGDEISKALDEWYPSSRTKLLDAGKSLIQGIEDFTEGLADMAKTATEAEETAQDVVNTLKKAQS